ncbi:MAG: hypothetical protein HOP28_14935, partial [Gemmatimonadales bacterium]|nr:hypothetical protein [Gemmatimonadales bacterium]
LTLSGFITVEEMRRWGQEIVQALSSLPDTFGIFVDLRTLAPLPPEAQAAMKQGQMFAKRRGMVRSVAIVENAITKLQFARIARETGIYAWERYVDASRDWDWEQRGLDWIIEGRDPDADEDERDQRTRRPG